MNTTSKSKALVHTVIQVRLPVRNIDESVAWYEKYFGFTHCWKTEEESDLKLEPGPYLFLKRVEQPNVTDPSGNIINIANYPDLHINGF